MTLPPARSRPFALLCLAFSLPLILAGCGFEKQKAELAEQQARVAELQQQIDANRVLIDRKLEAAQARLRRDALDAFERRLPRAVEMFHTAQAVKKDWDRIRPGTTKYDLVVYSEGADASRIKDHEAALDAMDRVEVRDVKVAGTEIKHLRIAYVDRSGLSPAGTTHERHFRATWTTEGKKVGLSYYSAEKLDVAAFADLLGRLIPVVNKHVSIKKGP